MYHKIREQERHPEHYVLKEIDPGMVEDECFDLMSRPRQTQKTIGLYLKKIKDAKECPPAEEENCGKKRFSLAPGNEDLEMEVQRNKGFWVGRPESSAPLVYQLRKRYSVIEQKVKRGKEQGIFDRPKYLELDSLVKMAKAGLLYPDEESSEEEEEIQPDDTNCLPLRKTVYKICDPCKPKAEKKKKEEAKPPRDLVEEMRMMGVKPPFRKIPTGCDCDFYGAHGQRPTVWDFPFEDEVDMLRQHEMNKVMKPYKHELLNQNYERNPPIKFMAHEPGMKRIFPIYQTSNL